MNDRIRVNLATEPLKNRRFFWIIVGAQVVLTAAVILISIIAVIRYDRGIQIMRNYIEVKEGHLRDVRVELSQVEEKINQMKESESSRIEFWNPIIRKKSFSWSEFLSDIEGRVPDACYIVSLAPQIRDESKIAVVVRLASPSLGHLVSFYSQLNKRKYQNIQVASEKSAPNGYLISEISFVYQSMD
jgi:hypothetical protein